MLKPYLWTNKSDSQIGQKDVIPERIKQKKLREFSAFHPPAARQRIMVRGKGLLASDSVVSATKS